MTTATHMPANDYRLPAEWEPQDGVQLTWPHSQTDWKPYLDDIVEVCVQLTMAISIHEKVLIAAQQPEDVKTLLAKRLDKTRMANVAVAECRNNDTWARDHAFLTLVPTPQAATGSANMLLDFRFNGWGEKFPADHDNAINRSLYAKGLFKGTRTDCNDFVLEGGSIESDGQGTIFTTSTCLLAPHRNQPLCRAEIEQRLLQTLHAERIIWLDHGLLIGDDTDGHIDTIVRPAPNDTLLYVGCDDETDPQHADFECLHEQLRQLRTAEGKPYRLLRLPMPRPMYDDGERLPATYANFLITNGAVIVPTYAQADNDAEAMHTISQAFAGREIVAVDARTVVRQHGSLHCLTMQYPKGSLNI